MKRITGLALAALLFWADIRSKIKFKQAKENEFSRGIHFSIK